MHHAYPPSASRTRCAGIDTQERAPGRGHALEEYCDSHNVGSTAMLRTSLDIPRETRTANMAGNSNDRGGHRMLGGMGIRANGDPVLDEMERASLRTARLAHFAAQNLSKIDKLSLM